MSWLSELKIGDVVLRQVNNWKEKYKPMTILEADNKKVILENGEQISRTNGRVIGIRPSNYDHSMHILPPTPERLQDILDYAVRKEFQELRQSDFTIEQLKKINNYIKKLKK